MSVELLIQKLNLDEAAGLIESQMNELNIRHKILLKGMKAIDKDQENMLESKSILAVEVRSIMRGLSINNGEILKW